MLVYIFLSQNFRHIVNIDISNLHWRLVITLMATVVRLSIYHRASVGPLLDFKLLQFVDQEIN